MTSQYPLRIGVTMNTGFRQHTADTVGRFRADALDIEKFFPEDGERFRHILSRFRILLQEEPDERLEPPRLDVIITGRG